VTANPSHDTAYADANLCIALLAGPAHWAHESALQVFRRVAEGHLALILTPLVLAELVYATRTLFRWNRSEASRRLAAFIAADGLVIREESQVSRALSLFGTNRIDFVDAYLAAVARDPGPQVVASFDRDFDKVDGLRRISS
jgi:predicted nucleic acid-binding protein